MPYFLRLLPGNYDPDAGFVLCIVYLNVLDLERVIYVLQGEATTCVISFTSSWRVPRLIYHGNKLKGKEHQWVKRSHATTYTQSNVFHILLADVLSMQ